MKLTNDLSLPQPIVDAVAFDPYTQGDADISVTAMVAPVRQTTLLRFHDGELVEDASDRIWSMVGQVGHLILERAAEAQWNEFQRQRFGNSDQGLADHLAAGGSLDETGDDGLPIRLKSISEQRLYLDVPLPDGSTYRLSGKADHLTIEDGVLRDWKFVSVWSIKDGAKSDWIEQTNTYAEIFRAHGQTINRIEIYAILRDWRKNEAKRYGGHNGDYPQKQVGVVPVPLWSSEEARAFITERCAAHKAARASYANVLPTLPHCSPSERWEKPTMYAVMKPKRKSAVRVLPDLAAAEARAKEEGAGATVVVRPGASVRCQDYCAAATMCRRLADGQFTGEEFNDNAEDPE
jgi:hypothetical protein